MKVPAREVIAETPQPVDANVVQITTGPYDIRELSIGSIGWGRQTRSWQRPSRTPDLGVLHYDHDFDQLALAASTVTDGAYVTAPQATSRKPSCEFGFMAEGVHEVDYRSSSIAPRKGFPFWRSSG